MTHGQPRSVWGVVDARCTSGHSRTLTKRAAWLALWRSFAVLVVVLAVVVGGVGGVVVVVLVVVAVVVVCWWWWRWWWCWW